MENTKRISTSSNGATTLQQSEPKLCSNGCGFFGTDAKKGLCSKCFTDLIIKNKKSAQAANWDVIPPPATLRRLIIKNKKYKDFSKLTKEEESSPESEEEEKKVADKKRCEKCNKKVGLIGFECRCGSTFCGSHRYAEVHGCGFDYKEKGKSEIAKANPVVKADKLVRF